MGYKRIDDLAVYQIEAIDGHTTPVVTLEDAKAVERYLRGCRTTNETKELTPEEVAARLNSYDNGNGWRGRTDWRLRVFSGDGSALCIYSDPELLDDYGDEVGGESIQLDPEDARAIVAGWDAQAEVERLTAILKGAGDTIHILQAAIKAAGE